MAHRDLDIIVHGATGFTGQLTIEYLVNKKLPLRLAISGRNRDKLEAVARQVGGSVEITVVSLDDHRGLVSLFRRAKVVATTAGPYANIGEPIVRACVEAKTTYLDLTGEPHWMRRMIDTYQAQAIKDKTLMCFSCGCDSVPYDIPIYHAANELAKAGHPGALGRVRTGMKVTAGSFSGGTFLSLLGVLETTTWKELFALSFDREYLSPFKNIKKRYRAMGFFFFDAWRFGGIWAASIANRATVYRTQSLLELAHLKNKKSLSYGRVLDYDDFFQTPDPLSALVLSSTMAFIAILAFFPFMGRVLRYLGPKSGSGPSKATRDRAQTTWTTIVRVPGAKATVSLHGKGDPGYKVTGGILAECAIMATKRSPDAPGGFITPALAFGSELLKQLDGTDMFTVKTSIDASD